MKFKFYSSVTIAVFFGILMANVLLSGLSRSYGYINKKVSQDAVYFASDFAPEMGARSSEVYEYNLTIAESSKYTKIDSNINFPNITASSFVVFDIDTGEIIESLNMNTVYPIASLTKWMTAITSIETIDQYEEIIITAEALATYGRQGNLRLGEKLTAHELLYPLLLESSNDASEAIAMYAGRTSFMNRMNEKAREIGMSDTFFDDPSGLSAFNTSSISDLITMTKYVNRNYGEIINISKMPDMRMKGHNWLNNSRFRNDRLYSGGKNGYTTEAKNTLISLFDLPLSEFGDRKIAIILLQSDQAERDMRNVVFYLLENIEYL